jgi:hypothetical protein
MNPSDLIAVFDEYLKRSGVGKNYMADKIFKLFNNKNSPFNIDGKLIKNLENSIDDFTKKIKAFKIPNLNAFVKGINGAVDNVKDFRDSFKITGLYAFNVAMEGALKNVRDFRDNLKISSLNAFKIAMEGALKNVRDFRDSFKITGLYAFDVAMKGALKNVRTFRDNLKIPNFSAFKIAMEGALREVRTFRDNLKIPSFSAFKIAMEGALKNVRDFRDNLKIPSLNAFKIAMDGALKNARGFRDNLKITGFYAFDVAMKGALREVRTFRDNLKVLNKSLSGGLGSLGTEAAVGTPTIVDVRLVDISQNAEDILTRIFSKLEINNTTINDTKNKDKDKGSFIGNLIKGILGTFALVAGVGFISEFLDTPIGRVLTNVFTNLKNKFVEMLKPFLKKIIDYSIEGLKVLFFELPKYFLKQTFNFFGLKEILGKENEGLAVLLTKGIYYGVKKFLIGIINKFSFGLFGAGMNLLRPQLDKLATSFLNTGMFETLKKVFLKISQSIKSAFSPILNAISAIMRPLSPLLNLLKSMGSKIVTMLSPLLTSLKSMGSKIVNSVLTPLKSIGSKIMSSLSSLFSPLTNLFSGAGAGPIGKVGKFIGSIGKTFSKVLGTAFTKLLGGGLKVIAKRIPLIGSLISFKDAYDRIKGGDLIGGLISIGSGIASIFPGIGTAISIGLDVLNMFLDRKAADPNSAVSKIKNFIKDIPSKIADTVTSIFGFFKDVLDMLNPLSWGKKIWDWATGKEEDISKELEKDTKKPDTEKPKTQPIETNPVFAEQKSTTRWDMPQKVGDGIITKNKVVVPSSSDDVVMAKNGGPFDLAFREMNQKLEQLSVIFAQGTELIANSTIQGSSSVAQAVVSTGGKQSPIVIAGKDPIADFRERANRFI